MPSKPLFPKRLVITGGPCSGKTSLCQRLLAQFPDQIMLVPEAARLILEAGLGSQRSQVPLEFQQAIMAVQKTLEDQLASLAATTGRRLLLCDRGVLDGLGYLSAEELFGPAGPEQERAIQAELDRYDGVLQLECLGRHRPELYAQDPQRSESLAQALALEERLKLAWGQHRGYRFMSWQAPLDVWEWVEAVWGDAENPQQN